jgi:2-polyprenyl-6-methoxyphenol hydroxylase-like FAD-dependent oxidoreductase
MISKSGFARTTVPIRDVEDAARVALAKHENVELLYGAEVTAQSDLRHTDRGWELKVISPSTGQSASFRAKYLIGADGPRSAVASLLGARPIIPAQYQSYQTDWVAGLLALPGDGWLRQVRIADESGRVESLKVSSLWGHKTVGLDAEIPVDHRFRDQEEMNDWWAERFPVFNLPSDAEVIIPPARFEVRLQRATAVAVQETAFLVGDSARTLHPALAAGMQAGFRDADRVAQTVLDLETVTCPARRRALVRRYTYGTSRATELLHARSVGSFPKPRGLRYGSQ